MRVLVPYGLRTQEKNKNFAVRKGPQHTSVLCADAGRARDCGIHSRCPDWGVGQSPTLVDTNVILDFFLSREPENKNATMLFEQIYQEKIEGLATASSITDIYYIMAKRLSADQTREAIYDLLNILEIIPVDGYDCSKALDLPIPDFEDALIVSCAKKADVQYIISHDKDFLRTDTDLVPVITAADFLNSYY